MRRFLTFSMMGLCAVLGLWPFSALGAAYQLEARTEAQAYQIRGYAGRDALNPVLLPRRRLVQYLGLNVYELLNQQPVGFESSLRVFADFGLPRGEAAKISGLRTEDADLLYANVHYRGKNLTLRIGRQLYLDMMDYLAFDGAHVRYTHDSGFGLEAYSGLWVRGAGLLGSSVYQPDGTPEGALLRFVRDDANPPAELNDVEPLVGAKAFVQNVSGFSASLAYRQAWVTGKTDIQRAALEARYGKGQGLQALVGAEYDLFMGRISQARGQLRYDAPEFAWTGDLFRFQPVLSADSIFLYFATAPRDEGRLRFDWTPKGRFRYYAQVLADVRHDVLNPASGVSNALKDPDLSSPWGFGSSLGTATRIGAWVGAADLTFKTGFGGSQLWLDVNGGFRPTGGLVSVEGRLSYAQIQDELNPLLKGGFLGGQLWGSFHLTSTSRLSAVLEQNVNPFTRSDTKVFFLFDVKAQL